MKVAVFIDRDGVITDLKEYNEKNNLVFLSKKEDIVFFERAVEAIKLLNQNNLEVIVVTNTPQIAKGIITEEQAFLLNEEIKKRFKEKGAIINAIYYCPHHPNGIIPKYSVECSCRKPKSGMLIQASRDRGIDLNKSYMIGDRISDIRAGDLAGCRTIGVRTGYGCSDNFKDAVPEKMANDLYDAVQLILEDKREVSDETIY